MMLISKSAPQPAIMNTPTGGTVKLSVVYTPHLALQPVGIPSQIVAQRAHSRKMVMMTIRIAETGFEPGILADASDAVVLCGKCKV